MNSKEMNRQAIALWQEWERGLRYFWHLRQLQRALRQCHMSTLAKKVDRHADKVLERSLTSGYQADDLLRAGDGLFDARSERLVSTIQG